MVFASLTYLTMTVSRSTHVAANVIVSFFYGCVVLHPPPTHTHIFIYSSVNGYLGCFHVLATVNSASVNIGVVHISF